MINAKADISGLDKLQKQLNFVESIKSNDNRSLNEYLGNKSLEVLNKVISMRLNSGTTNDEYIEEYKKNNILSISDDGFTLYNHTMADLSELKPETRAKYPQGFSIAMAFEYGVGIVGENAPVEGAWEYNINNYNFAWKYKKDGVVYSTYGYQGMEIYRYAKEEIIKQLPKWVKEYYERGVK